MKTSMKVTVTKHNKDTYIIIKAGRKTATFKAKMIMRTSEYSRTSEYESEVFEATLLSEVSE